MEQFDKETHYRIIAARLRWWADALDSNREHAELVRDSIDMHTGYNASYRADEIHLMAAVRIKTDQGIENDDAWHWYNGTEREKKESFTLEELREEYGIEQDV